MLKNRSPWGLTILKRIFGYRPLGMWPSEGAVSEEAVRIASKEGIQWLELMKTSLQYSFENKDQGFIKKYYRTGNYYTGHICLKMSH